MVKENEEHLRTYCTCLHIHRLIPGHFRCDDEMPGDGDPLSLSVLENLIYFLKSLKCGLGSGVWGGVDVEVVGSGELGDIFFVLKCSMYVLPYRTI